MIDSSSTFARSCSTSVRLPFEFRPDPVRIVSYTFDFCRTYVPVLSHFRSTFVSLVLQLRAVALQFRALTLQFCCTFDALLMHLRAVVMHFCCTCVRL